MPSLTLPYLTLPYLTLPYLTLPYLTLSYLILSYFTLTLTLTLTLPYHHTQPPKCLPHFYLFFHHQSTVSRKRETKKLFENSRNLYGGDKDSDTEKLLGERTAIDASRRSMDNVLRYILLRMTSMSCTLPHPTFFSPTLPSPFHHFAFHHSLPLPSDPIHFTSNLILVHLTLPFSSLHILSHFP